MKLTGGYSLLFTISMYSSSVGQVRLSRQNRSSPWPRCRFKNSSGGIGKSTIASYGCDITVYYVLQSLGGVSGVAEGE